MYCFTLFAYHRLYESYPQGYCDSIFLCLLTTIDRGFKTDGGIGGLLKSSTFIKPNDTKYFF